MEILQIHADRTLPATVDGDALPWVPSPEPGVDRRMLERSGDEVAIASSIVRYAPGSRFPRHTHALGEEFFVLSGVFSDADGDYPEGTYVRNPPGSWHAPFSENGCVIFVKLRQMSSDESEVMRVLPGHRLWKAGKTRGHDYVTLYDNGRINVTLERLLPGTVLPARVADGGEEILVVEGEVELPGDNPAALGKWAWRRQPGVSHLALSSKSGALLWLKRGHLG
jgi:anti-sigma factor ChrR (cupin superfamily)